MPCHPCFALFALALALAAGARGQGLPADIDTGIRGPFRFVAYGDTRFTDPANTSAANAEVRQMLVKAIAEAHPDFVTFGGDIAYNGNNANDWKIYDQETAVWRERKITVYPALGNHDLHGDLGTALGNYFARFPALHESRYYAVRTANSVMLTLDSSLDELSGPQGDWLRQWVEHLAGGTDFVFIVLHHPPYTSSSNESIVTMGGGHSARAGEQALAAYLERAQAGLRARIIVFSGHVHNYERHQHGGVLYFVSGGGGAHAYPIKRAKDDPFQSGQINYHYILAEVGNGTFSAAMNRLEVQDHVARWSQPDRVTVQVPPAGKQ